MTLHRIILLGILALLGTGNAFSSPASDHAALRDAILRDVIGKGDPAVLLSRQATHLASREKLLQFAFLDQFTPEVVSKVSAIPQGETFIRTLRGNPVWLRMLMSSGPINNPEQTLNHLASIWKQDPACATRKELQTLSIAIALEFGKNKWPQNRAWTRYAFYRDSQKLGLLHPIYDSLDAWEKRYLAGHSINLHGGEKSQIWLRDNVKLPAEKYRSACWQLSYRSHNFFGDSVQGPMYYFPYQGSFNSFSEMTRYVGGVCGRLSGYGAAAAVANGIPATTMGEPGHCAYTVRVARGQWKPAYTLSWKRSVHVRFYKNSSYNLLVLTEAIFSDTKALENALTHLWQTRAMKTPASIRAAYLLAIKAQPINYEAWENYGNWLMAQKNVPLKHWQEFHTSAINAYTGYPEVAWNLISRFAYPHILKDRSPREKIRILSAFHRKISSWGPNRWDFERALTRQAKLLGGDTNDQFAFFKTLLTLHKNSPAYSGTTLAWGQSHFNKSIDQQKKYILIATRIMSQDGNKSRQKPLFTMANRLILDAEKNNDPTTFALAGSMLRRIHQSKPGELAQPAFSGELLSEGAMIRTSGTCRYDTPWKHYFLPSRQTGFFHTPRQNNPWVELTLKQFGELSGIEIVNWTRFRSRVVPLKVEVSEDGKTWQEITTLKKPRAVWKIDLKGKKIRARHIRLTKQGHDFLHLNNIRVYGKRRS